MPKTISEEKCFQEIEENPGFNSDKKGVFPEKEKITKFCKHLSVGVRMLKSGGCAGPPRILD